MSEFSLNEIIEMAVQIEKNGYSFYDRALKRDDLDLESRELITMLRNDEIKHERTFKSLRERKDLDKIIAAGDWTTVGSYLKAIAESHIFSDSESAINRAVESGDFLEIVKHAMSFEKDTLLFFHSLERYVSDEDTSRIIGQIIDEEAGHVMRLKKILKERQV